MINAFIISKNRAPQLRLLLESIKTYCPDLFNKIKIVWTASTQDFEDGYAKLDTEEILPNIEWKYETNFFQDFLDGIRDIGSPFICGIVDDCVFYRKLHLKADSIIQTFGESQFCFSLRLGQNTTLQDYINNTYQAPVKPHSSSSFVYNTGDSEGAMFWNWKTVNPYHNYGYPISLDGHIYRSQELYEISTIKEFKCLREWEGFLATNIRDITTRDVMGSPATSAVYSIPANCVQDPPMVAGVKMRFTPERLNELYLKENKVIDLNCIKKGSEVNFCHNEMMLKMRQL